MTYITVMQRPMYKQITLEQFLFSNDCYKANGRIEPLNSNVSNTKTYVVEHVSEKLMGTIDVNILVAKLAKFNAVTEEIRSAPRESLYYTFHIPKKSRGFRRIDAPNAELMNALRSLKTIFEEDFHALYHTSAFAYVKNRCAVDAVKKHQSNKSRWFGKFDCSNFFGSTTLEFVMQQFSMVFPFSEIMKYPAGRIELQKALELCFLNGGLPQGTPISPLITNIMMIPIDHKLSNGLREYNDNRYVYTRYADDIIVSSKYDFDIHSIESYILNVFSEFNCPFKLNDSKTRYGSSAGRNWNLGVILNKDNQITIGHKRKRQFQASLSSYVLDRMNGNPWSKEDVMVLDGQKNYYKSVEGDAIINIIHHIGSKYNVDIDRMIKEDLRK